MPNRFGVLFRVAFATWLASQGFGAIAQADTVCELSFTQNGVKLMPETKGRWLTLRLAKAPFELQARPADCYPVMATLMSAQAVAEASGLTEIVFSGTGDSYAASEEQKDILHWASREPIVTTLAELTSEWSVIDTYKAESERLGYSPRPVRAWGSAWPFQLDANGRVAKFRRLTAQIALSPEMPSVQLPVIVYLPVKDLMKPTWHNAIASWRLRRPYRIVFVFN